MRLSTVVPWWPTPSARGFWTLIRRCAGRSSATSWVNRPRSGKPRGHGSRSKASANAFWRYKIPMANGPAGRSSPQTSTSTAPKRQTVGNPGLRRHGRSTRCGSGALTRRSCASAAPPNFSPKTADGTTTTSLIGAVRWTAASTLGRSPTVCGSAPTSPASSTGSSNIDCPMGAGTAIGSRAPVDRPTTQRSTPSRDFSPTTPRPAAATPHTLPDTPGRSTCCSGGSFAACRRPNRWRRG